jgi:hypothetical protein
MRFHASSAESAVASECAFLASTPIEILSQFWTEPLTWDTCVVEFVAVKAPKSHKAQ